MKSASTCTDDLGPVGLLHVCLEYPQVGLDTQHGAVGDLRLRRGGDLLGLLAGQRGLAGAWAHAVLTLARHRRLAGTGRRALVGVVVGGGRHRHGAEGQGRSGRAAPMMPIVFLFIGFPFVLVLPTVTYEHEARWDHGKKTVTDADCNTTSRHSMLHTVTFSTFMVDVPPFWRLVLAIGITVGVTLLMVWLFHGRVLALNAKDEMAKDARNAPQTGR